MKNILKKNIHDLSNKLGSEFEQSLMRLFVILITYSYIYIWVFPQNNDDSKLSILFAIIYTVLALLLFASIKLNPKLSNSRIIIGMVLDISTVSAYMVIGDHWVLGMSWIYLIIIIGNGFRFGVQYLNIAFALSLIGFTVACTIADYWTENITSILVVYISLLVLSFYVKMLLKRLNHAIEAANSSAKAKSQFLANMSHEIRTPMNGVLGMLELALNEPLDKPQRKRLTIAKNSADALLVLLNDILDLSKIEAGKVSFESIDFNLKVLAKEVVRLLEQRAIEKNITLSYSFKSDLGKQFRGDPTRIRQTIINLVGNAIKFTNEGGVKVDVTVERQQQNLCFKCHVSDTGIGISKESQQHIFHYFTQADTSTTRNFGGTGLGLALSQRLVDEMGGKMEVSSELGKGSVFSFMLPLKPAKNLVSSQGSPKQKINTLVNHQEVEKKSIKKVNVLVAEDNVVNQIVIEQMLTQLNCNVTMKNNGQLLLDAMTEKQQHNYDLIFMDCQMPVMDGYEATESLQEFWQLNIISRRIPIVALTANVMLSDKQKCLDSGMDDYLAKPIKMDALSETIEKWTEQENNLLQINENSTGLIA
ncbi:MAG TPA: response regulator [Leucothrix mucor]|nr:response regulator [Leucothrix mucor]